MEHEEIFTLMMKRLDGELEQSRHAEMQAHLQACPACAREWQAIQAIHQLFLQTPALSPAAGFAERTLARIPDARYRFWFVGALYGILLVSGAAPLAFAVWLLTRFAPALNQPALLRSVVQAGGEIWRLGQVVLLACWQGLGDLGELLSQQPSILGWLMVMVGVVMLWTGIYSQLTTPQHIMSERR